MRGHTEESDTGLTGPDWRACFRDAAIVLAVAVVATAAVWALRGDRLPLTAQKDFYELEVAVPLVDIAEALDLFDEGDRLFIDTRPAEGGAAETISGAFSIRAASFDDDLYELADIVYPEDPVLLFGNGDLSGVSHVADLLLARGFEDVLIMTGSVSAWRGQGGDVSTPEPDSASDAEGTP